MSIISCSLAGAAGLESGFVPDTTQRHPLGTRIEVMDSYWGFRRLAYGKNAAAAYKVGQVLTADASMTMTVSGVATTALNAPLFVCLHNMASGTYGWYLEEGVAPVYSYATVAANALPAVDSAHAGMIVASGTGHLRIRNLAVLATSTTTATATLIQQQGTTRLQLSTVEGMFLGGVISATGISSSQTITAIDEPRKIITLSAAVDSTPSGTITMTYQGTSNEFWEKCRFRFPANEFAVS